MIDLPDNEGPLDALRGAQDALAQAAAPDAEVLEAVQAGLLSVAGVAPHPHYEIPKQRQRPLPPTAHR
jgi:hypothetical protein